MTETYYYTIVNALRNYSMGRHHARGLHGEYFDEQTTGYRVALHKHVETKDSDGNFDYIVRYCVDHVGKGRKAALVEYLNALQAAGIPARLDAYRPWLDEVRGKKGKQVVWVDVPVNRLGQPE